MARADAAAELRPSHLDHRRPQDHDGIDFTDWMRIVAEDLGLQIGFRCAEAFVEEEVAGGVNAGSRS